MNTITEKVAQMVATAQVITVASIDENGYPRPVAMVKIKDEDGEIYVSTGASSAKVAHFRTNPKAGVSIVRGGDSIVYTGEMEIVEDGSVKRSLWGDWMLLHFPGGVEDPEYCVLRFTPKSATYWIDNAFVKDEKLRNIYCQSCGMPMPTAELFGTNTDGSANEEYCCYCYKGGKFVQDCTMDGMIEHCIKYLDEYNGACNTQYSKEEAIAEMKKHFPKLKRWAKKKKLTTEEDYRQRVDKVAVYIREHLDSEIDIRTLAELSAFSPFHFHRIMRGYLGETIGAFIVRTRVQTAAKLLRYTDLQVSDIAYQVGYDTPSSLTKSFCKLFGVSPKEYRQTKSYQIMTAQQKNVEVNISYTKVVEQEPKTVLYINASGSYKNVEYGVLYERMWAEVKRQGAFSAGIEHLAIYYDNPEIIAEENLKCDVCLRICKPVEPNGDIGVKTIEGGRFAMFTYIGEYKKVGAAYDKIYGELLAKSGFETRSNYCYEKYVSDPRRTAPEKLKTEIYIPIE